LEGKRSFTLKASFIELYNEEVKDLFDPIPKNIQVREDKQDGIILVGASEKPIASFDEMMRLVNTRVVLCCVVCVCVYHLNSMC
jgi:hypothetical protein